MKKRAVADLLFISLLLAAAPAAQAQTGPDFTRASETTAAQGEWIWGILNDPVLSSGVTTIATDRNAPSTIYAGCTGFIAVSTDSGATWSEKFRLPPKTVQAEAIARTAQDSDSGEDGDETARQPLTDAQRLEILRNYLQMELEEEFEADIVEELLEEITDDELLTAESIEDIDSLKNLDLEMEPDLRHVLAEAELAHTADISIFAPFSERYQIMRNSGAEDDIAIDYAALSASVWSFASASGITYAVTSDAVYMTNDQGTNWETFVSAPEDMSILAMDVSDDAKTYAIGMTRGMILTRNAGADWVNLGDVIEGAVYKIDIASANDIWVLTTKAMYRSKDNGLSWHEVATDYGEGEYAADVIPGASGNVFMLTNRALYYSADTSDWDEVPCGPFPDEIIRQVEALDPMLSSFIVRTDSHVFEYSQATGWVSLNDMLFADRTGHLITLSDGYSNAALATPSGIWIAQTATQIRMTPEYKALLDKWSKEPSDYEVIHKALEAHYLDDTLNSSWGLRSKLSWLLPTISFDYYRRQRNTDKHELRADFESHHALNFISSLEYRRETISYWQVMARWNIQFDKGVKDERAGVSQEVSLKGRRDALIKKVRSLIAKRRSYQMTVMLDFPKLPEGKRALKKVLKTTLALEETEANLHYLTGGYFMAAVREDRIQDHQ